MCASVELRLVIAVVANLECNSLFLFRGFRMLVDCLELSVEG